MLVIVALQWCDLAAVYPCWYRSICIGSHTSHSFQALYQTTLWVTHRSILSAVLTLSPLHVVILSVKWVTHFHSHTICFWDRPPTAATLEVDGFIRVRASN